MSEPAGSGNGWEDVRKLSICGVRQDLLSKVGEAAARRRSRRGGRKVYAAAHESRLDGQGEIVFVGGEREPSRGRDEYLVKLFAAGVEEHHDDPTNDDEKYEAAA